MGIFKKIYKNIAGAAKRKTQPSTANAHHSNGLLVFEHTGDVIRAERVLKNANFKAEVMGPPPNLRTGCDMVICFELIKELAVRETLANASINPLKILPLSEDLLEPVALFHSVDLGDWFMIRAANMKITVHKESGVIVNISGGGCPDVPYLASLLTNKCIADAEEPRIQGQTLCAYSLQKAFEEARRVWLSANR